MSPTSKKHGIRVLGVDPGLARIGVAVVEGEAGNLSLVHVDCIETDASLTDGDRLVALRDSLAEVIVAFAPSIAAVERLFFATNRRTAMRVSEARGVILYGLARASVEIAEYTPLQVKESLAGYGAADKAQLARMTTRLLGLESIPGPDDASDACALAVCHHHRMPLAAGSQRALDSLRAAEPQRAAESLRAADFRPGSSRGAASAKLGAAVARARRAALGPAAS